MFDRTFLPHSICLALDPGLLMLHALSDGVSAISYYAIAVVIFAFSRRRAEGKFRWVLFLFAAFVLACGTTHVVEVVTLWVPIYVAQGFIKAITATVSLSAAIAAWPLLPKALALPTAAELEREVEERKKTEREVREANLRLEARVSERTHELERAKAAAERANQAKSRFLAAASHDLRQPFQAMCIYHDILGSRLTAPADKHTLELLGQAMEAGQSLLKALLDISTLDAGVTVPKRQSVSLGALLLDLASEFREQAASRSLQLRVVSSSGVVETDPILLGRMLRNLIVNALKYTLRGSILVGCRRSGGAIRIEVWDTGPGIPAERQTEIWEEFTQLHNPERDQSKGLGLGLAIVARTAQLLGHRVGLRSWPGRGSVFFLELPVSVHQADERLVSTV
jgi:two-component system, sensor histidine kinase